MIASADLSKRIRRKFQIIYSSQKYNSKKRGHMPPSYSFMELYDWITIQPNFDFIISKWVDSGFKKNMAPSIDRINDFLGYFIENIRLTTWEDNSFKAHKDRFNGVGASSSVCFPIIQITPDGIFLREYVSAKYAARENNYKSEIISRAARCEDKKAYGFLWVYKKNYNPLKKYRPAAYAYKRTSVIQCSLDGNFIKEYDTITSAAIEVGGFSGNISRAIRSEKPIYGYLWRKKA